MSNGHIQCPGFSLHRDGPFRYEYPISRLKEVTNFEEQYVKHLINELLYFVRIEFNCVEADVIPKIERADYLIAKEECIRHKSTEHRAEILRLRGKLSVSGII